MHKLPKDFDGAFLVGRMLEQLCFSENQVTLHFDGDIDITIESAFLYDDGVLAPKKSSVPPSQSNLMQLLGKAILKLERPDDDTLVLVFENGHQLSCFETPQYESYQIRHGQNVIIV